MFWLALSFLLVVISLTAVLMVAIPALRELGRAARSAEKFFDTLGRELPPTLEAIRLTGLEIVELTDDVTEGVQSAGQVAQQVTQSIATAQTGAKRLNTGTKSFFAGARAAWRTWTDGSPPQPPTKRAAGATKVPPASAPPGTSPGDSPPDPTPLLEAEEHRISVDRSAPRPHLAETTLHAIPDSDPVNGLNTIRPAEPPALSPRRSPQELRHRSATERD
nr:DUF948 domain-containing protein [Nodosilinea sp. TSF1-S3]